MPDDRNLRPGPGHLPAHGQRQQPADEKPQQRGEQELDADHLVIARKDIRAQEARLCGRGRRNAKACWPGVRGHAKRRSSCSFGLFLGSFGGCVAWRHAWRFASDPGLAKTPRNRPRFPRSIAPSSCNAPSRKAGSRLNRRCRSRIGRNQTGMFIPGTASCFTRMLGKKKLCSTSSDFRCTSTILFTGT